MRLSAISALGLLAACTEVQTFGSAAIEQRHAGLVSGGIFPGPVEPRLPMTTRWPTGIRQGADFVMPSMG